jgi:hypothetical protein
VSNRKNKYLWSFILVLILLSSVFSGCGGSDPDLAFSQLISQADQYNGKTVILEAFYFSGFEISALSETLGPSTFADGRMTPSGNLIWVAGGISQALYDKLFTQTTTLPGYAEHFGKLRIAGKFESIGSYGHLNSYNYQITIISAVPLDWTPVPASVVNNSSAAEGPVNASIFK